jgi:25S rRNA (adenine2142-N1)-methyltransferase
LEVGALSTHNACSISPLFEIERIDLNSQSPGILKQDFMQRPLPNDDSESFDIISLSLVLNFVPTPQARGDMLKRTVKHLRSSSPVPQAEPKHLLPGLFMVLPAPCVLNSRYLDEATLVAIMASLSYAMVRQKVTSKLHYTLWQWHPGPPAEGTSFKKQEILGGRARNNFAITLG